MPQYPEVIEQEGLRLPLNATLSKAINRSHGPGKAGHPIYSPTIAAVRRGVLQGSFSRLGKKMGRTPRADFAALKAGFESFRRYEKLIEQRQRRTIGDIRPGETCSCLSPRSKGSPFRFLNLGKPEKLQCMGYDKSAFLRSSRARTIWQNPNLYLAFRPAYT